MRSEVCMITLTETAANKVRVMLLEKEETGLRAAVRAEAALALLISCCLITKKMEIRLFSTRV